jgi:hypothetical protein
MDNILILFVVCVLLAGLYISYRLISHYSRVYSEHEKMKWVIDRNTTRIKRLEKRVGISGSNDEEKK